MTGWTDLSGRAEADKIPAPSARGCGIFSVHPIFRHGRMAGMKSAYELAMSRLEKSSPTVALTEEQKRLIAEVDSEVSARIAEKKIFLEGEMLKADAAERESIQRQLVSELARLEEKREREKEKIRTGQRAG